MAGDDDTNYDEQEHSVARRSTNNMTSLVQFGLPASVVDMLRRMAPYNDRLSWTLVENAHVVSLSLNWNVQRCPSLSGVTSGGNDSGNNYRIQSDNSPPLCGSSEVVATTKDSLWNRIRRTLQYRRNRSLSVNGMASVVRAAMNNERHRHHGNQQNASAMTSSSSSSAATTSGVSAGPESFGSCSGNAGRARTARELWRKSVERDKQATGHSTDGLTRWSRGTSWSPGRSQSEQEDSSWWNVVDRLTSTDRSDGSVYKDSNINRSASNAVHSAAVPTSQYGDIRRSARRLQPSMSLPERIVPVALRPQSPWQPEKHHSKCCYDNNGGQRRSQCPSLYVSAIYRITITPQEINKHS